ncbi:hypothetical protein IKE_06263 [Bacillus cereus VD196]|uniref:Uncharacterized protein n=1 Tax=Bacillus cereus VD196 TaxID=1053243 RepID=A0A9W5PXV4_BACCE|nr:hypothetical protein [Bacillus cereus]EOO58570.1 hypothetical protein IKE_06263 [Bacillus cereus VD196]
MKVRLLLITGSVFGLLYILWRLFAMSLAGGDTTTISYDILVIFPVLSIGLGLLSCFLYNRYQKLANIILCFSISNALFLSIESILIFFRLPNINDFEGVGLTSLEISNLHNDLFILIIFSITFPILYFIFTSIGLMSLIKNKHYTPYYLLILILTLIMTGFMLLINYF